MRQRMYGLNGAALRRSLLMAMVGVLMALTALAAMARPGYEKILAATYGLKSDGFIAKKNCQACHTNSLPNRNPYGQAVGVALKAANTKTLTAGILNSIDEEDADGDAVSNAQELSLDTLPGDPNSKTAGPVTAGKPPKKTNATKTAATTEPESSGQGLFSFKALFFPKHGQHPIVVHFPVALLMISLLFDLAGKLLGEDRLHEVGYMNLCVGAFTSPIAILTGFLAWQLNFGGISLDGFKSNTLLRTHLLLGVATTVMAIVLWRMRKKERRRDYISPTRAYMIAAIILIGLLSLTGHYGGAMVFGME